MNPFDQEILIHAIEDNSTANGPGQRLVLWVQGCTLKCPGCFNPATHPLQSGKKIKINTLLKHIKAQAQTIEGLTISGGEPLQQFAAIHALCAGVKQQTELGIIVLTGYSYREARALPLFDSFTASIDLFIAGRFNQSQKIKSGLRGSTNKTYHFFTDRYHRTQLEQTSASEVIIKSNGEIIITGIDPLTWTQHEA